MVVGCFAKFSKVVLFAINIVFFLAGAAILGVGLWLRFDKNVEVILKAFFLDSLSDLLTAAAYILIAFGAIVFAVGFCGCCGAIKESKCLMGFYLAFVVIVLVGELAGGIFVYVNYELAIEEVEKPVLKSLASYNLTENREDVEQPWNFLMIRLECCGWKNARNSSLYPDACCFNETSSSFEYGKFIVGDSGQCSITTKKACFDVLKEPVKSNAVTAIAVVGGIAAVEILVFIMALGFCCGLDKESSKK